MQREITKRIVLEAAYVGNRGVWLEANNLVSHNAIAADAVRRSSASISTTPPTARC